MNTIRILSEKVASQIAAGEIIERPASIVRELLDNSIDAGSKKITVKIEKGGKGVIRVSDNGSGMSRDDLLLCIERHATSKVNSVEDLFAVKTLGFRGEALPSISSVSRMVMTSRPSDQLAGYCLKIAGGRIKSIGEAGSPIGTAIEVRDVFFNMPARRKFLRTVKTESSHIIDTFSRITLPFTNIHFQLNDEVKTILNFAVTKNEINRISVLFGRDVAGSMIDAFQETGEFALNAYLGPPDLNRSRGDRIFIYVNSRNVRDRLITRALMESYGQRLMKGRYPQAVLFINIDPSLVDINIHPTKQEVRFHNSQAVYRAITAVIERTLGKSSVPVFNPAYPEPEGIKGEGIQRPVMAEPEWEYSDSGQEKIVSAAKGIQEEYLIKEVPQIIGQLNNTYILCQNRDGLLMIDQHAAHERIVYETLKKSYGSSRVESQSFLIPLKLELSLREGRVLLEKPEQLASMGLELEHFGGSTFLLRAVPSILIDVQWEKFLADLIPQIEKRGISNDEALDRLLTVMACHGAVRAGKQMALEEMTALLNQLEEMDLPTHCPHGRPIFQKISYYEIEKMFKRVV